MKYLESFNIFGKNRDLGKYTCKVCGEIMFNYHKQTAPPYCTKCKNKNFPKLRFFDPAVPKDFSPEERENVRKYNL